MDDTVEKTALAQTKMRQGDGETILVVDDEVFITKMASIVLIKNGYKVLTAAEGSSAMALYREYAAEIKLVLTDVMMPGMDGISRS